MNHLYYKTNQGNWISHNKLEQAFRTDTGHYSFEAQTEFITWLSSQLGSAILEIKRANDKALIREFVKANQKALALRSLHIYYGFELSKAKQIVDGIEGKLSVQGKRKGQLV